MPVVPCPRSEGVGNSRDGRRNEAGLEQWGPRGIQSQRRGIHRENPGTADTPL